MKKLAILSITLLFVCTVGQINARTTSTGTKNEMKKESVVVNTTKHPESIKDEGDVVNQNSKINFYSTIGDVSNVVWTRGDYFDAATYTQEGTEMIAYFDFSGELVGTTTTIKVTELSSALQKSIQKKYSDCTIGQVTFFQESDQDGTDSDLYGNQFENQGHYFIELSKNTDKFMVQGESNGDLSFFKQL